MRDLAEGDLLWAAGAAGAWSAIRSVASGEIREVRLVHRGEGRFWSALTDEIQSNGIATLLTTLGNSDQQWSPSVHTDGASGDLLIYHDPLDAVVAQPSEPPATTQFSEILKRFRYAVFLGYPHGLSDPRLQLELEQRYLAALAYPVRALQRRAEAVRSLAQSATHVQLCSSGAQTGINFAGPFQAHHDWTLQGDPGRLLQLPLGEAWLTLEASHRAGASGVTSLPSRGSGQVKLTGLGVAAGRAGTLSFCELGVGVNPALAPLGTSVLSEKADSSLHAGFGENGSIGGSTSGPPHGDLMLGDRSELRLTLPSKLNAQRSNVAFGKQAETFLTITHVTTGEMLGVMQMPTSEQGLVDLPASIGAESAAKVTVTRFPAATAGERLDNILALELLADPRFSEVVTWQADSKKLGVFGPRSAGLGSEPPLQRFFEAARAILGELPWSTVDVVVGDNLVARGLSRPGAILIDSARLENRHELRWLYISHELIHQWLGGMLRLGPRHASAWEAVCEMLAHAIAVAVLGPDTAAVFKELQQRQGLFSGMSDPGWTGKSVATLRREFHGMRALLARSVSGARRIEDISVQNVVPQLRSAVACGKES